MSTFIKKYIWYDLDKNKKLFLYICKLFDSFLDLGSTHDVKKLHIYFPGITTDSYFDFIYKYSISLLSVIINDNL